jgi:hypothetical protein
MTGAATRTHRDSKFPNLSKVEFEFFYLPIQEERLVGNVMWFDNSIANDIIN